MTKTTKGIICLILSAFCFAAMAVFVRFAGDINFMQKAFFRNSISFLIALVLLVRDGMKNGRETLIVPKGALLFLFLRSAGGSLGFPGDFWQFLCNRSSGAF